MAEYDPCIHGEASPKRATIIHEHKFGTPLGLPLISQIISLTCEVKELALISYSTLKMLKITTNSTERRVKFRVRTFQLRKI